jgi:DNA polymerase I-like protein with 3'-5' exonuclease and polymerase domains
MKRGMNLQNVDREARDTFLPDLGQVWLAFDGSAVEDRDCKVLSGSQRLIDIANLHPCDFDSHRYVGSFLFNVPYDQVTKEQRDIAKRVAHASQRGMRGKRLAGIFLKEEERIVSVKDCDAYIDAYLEQHWEIRDIYFPAIRNAVIRNKKLVNSWGRVLDFGTAQISNDLYQEAYSFPMQSECIDWLVRRGFRPTWHWLKNNNMKSHILTQEHDGFAVSAEPEEAYSIAQFVVQALERPVIIPTYGTVSPATLVIPVTVTVSRSWMGEPDQGTEFKRLPSEAVFNQAVSKARGV